MEVRSNFHVMSLSRENSNRDLSRLGAGYLIYPDSNMPHLHYLGTWLSQYSSRQ